LLNVRVLKERYMLVIEPVTVEVVKKQLGATDEQRSHVDWLTEVIKRLSDAFNASNSFTTVNMKTVARTEKVFVSIWPTTPDTYSSYFQWKTFETRYQDKPWTEDEKGVFEDAILANGPELRSIREEVGTGKRSQAEVVRYYAHWKNSKLREENEMKRAGTFRAPSTSAAAGDSSVVASMDVDRACAACRAEASRTWHKAPKGLVSDVLCDQCDLNWRKYAELNVRPLREEVQAKGKPDKREGMPLMGTVAKRLKVGICVFVTQTGC
jgi:hypothetical protein